LIAQPAKSEGGAIAVKTAAIALESSCCRTNTRTCLVGSICYQGKKHRLSKQKPVAVKLKAPLIKLAAVPIE